jgi:osmotically-inducible protein OsmY
MPGALLSPDAGAETATSGDFAPDLVECSGREFLSFMGEDIDGRIQAPHGVLSPSKNSKLPGTGFHPIPDSPGITHFRMKRKKEGRNAALPLIERRKHMKPTLAWATSLVALFSAITLITLFFTLRTPVAPARASGTDGRIESAFFKSYVFQTYLHDDAILARSQDGNAVLTGKVAEQSHKDLAEETMASLPGVKSVENRLNVKRSAPSENSDKWTHMKIKTALLFHRGVNARNTRFSVKDGRVILHGPADNQAQKDLTSEIVADVQGVNSLKNNMTISKAGPSLVEKTLGKIDDASITAQVKVSLMSRQSTSALNTHVKTMDGVVTVSGKAGNISEKDLVTKVAEAINGVKSVVNGMVVSAAVPGM